MRFVWPALFLMTVWGEVKSQAVQAQNRPTRLLKEYQKGRGQAGVDVAKGVYIIKTYGLRNYGPEQRQTESVMWRDYKVHVVPVAGCVVSSELCENVRGYNEVSVGAIKARFGPDYEERAHQKALGELGKSPSSTAPPVSNAPAPRVIRGAASANPTPPASEAKVVEGTAIPATTPAPGPKVIRVGGN